jgi:nitrile hydratase subunit beta
VTLQPDLRNAEVALIDGIHDLGGLDGFGPVRHSPAERVFAEAWERRALAAVMGTIIALDAGGPRFRHSIERMDPAHYLASSYYEHWLTGVATLLVEANVTSVDELEHLAGGVFPLSRSDRGKAPDQRETDRTEPRYSPGDRVRVRAWHPPGHTRAPRYVQGKRGVVVRLDGPANLPDLEAHGGGKVLDPTYSVAFTTLELWGEAGDAAATVRVDLWERYLEEDP